MATRLSHDVAPFPRSAATNADTETRRPRTSTTALMGNDWPLGDGVAAVGLDDEAGHVPPQLIELGPAEI